MHNSSCISPDHSNSYSKNAPPILLDRRYRVERLLGAGGFAKTFLAVDERCLEKPCVIKQFFPPQERPETHLKAAELFRQEATILGKLGDHPQIPSLLASFEELNKLYLVQEFFDGQDLFKELTQRGTFSELQIIKVLIDLLSVLQFTHVHNVIHRDIKPSNIIRQTDGPLILIDFGSSLQLCQRISSNTGTPGYAAPEQMRGKVSPASDLYSLGVTCIRLMTGLLPMNDGSDPLFKLSQDSWDWRQTGLSVSPKLRRVFDKLLHTDIDKRFQSAEDALKALENPFLGTIVPVQNKYPSKQSLVNSRNTQFSVSANNGLGADYRKLQLLLSNQKFEEADQETWRLLLEISNRVEYGSLNIGSLRQFPLNDLQIIDQLWCLLSNGRFGFSVQKRIYERLGGSIIFDFQIWQKLGGQVGWFNGEDWLTYSHLTFDLDAPEGHLPAPFISAESRLGNTEGGLFDWWRLGFATLMHRLNEK